MENEILSYKLEYISCYLCGSKDYEVWTIAKDLLHMTPGEFHIVRCNRCGLVYLNPRPTLETIPSLYQEDYGPYQTFKKHKKERLGYIHHLILSNFYNYPGKRSTLQRLVLLPFYLRNKWYSKKVRIIPFTGEGRLLDVGCGNGAFLYSMRQLGWDVWGVEPNEKAVQHVYEELGLKNVKGSLLLEQGYEDQQFDVVTLWHSLEHMPNPREVLEEIHRILKLNGLLLIAAPNIKSYAAQRFKNLWYALDAPRHLIHFSPDTLSYLLKVTGFTVQEIRQERRLSSLQTSLKREDKVIGRLIANHRYILRLWNLLIQIRKQSDVIVVLASPCN
jgi:2-polyprenyl-3-methyl-5-hydroxy-6-metoxy-1,4-benzoquinol methylase